SPPLDVSKDQFEDFFDSDNEFSSTDDDSSSIDNIDHVEVSSPDSELVSSEVMEIVIPEETNTFDNYTCDVPAREEFTTFSNILLDADYEFNSSDDRSFSDEKFVGELTLLKSIPSGIDETDCDLEEDIRLIEKLLYDNSLPHPLKEFVFENSDAETESFSPSPIPVKDRILDVKMMGDISDQKVPMHKLMITLASHQEKSPDLLSHRGLKTFQPSAKCPMMIHGKNNPILDVLLFYFYPP
nr:hypothetical protein [Tanacetum cinerariifolium]